LEEFPKTDELIQNYFIRQWPKIFANCITNKSLLFKYFKRIIDILESETELEEKENPEKEEEEVNHQK
jgi:hypothetical protein